MKNLIVCALINLLTACAAFPMGGKCACDSIKLPPKPDMSACIADIDGTMWCSGTQYPVVNNYCRSPQSDAAIKIWIDHAWDAVNR